MYSSRNLILQIGMKKTYVQPICFVSESEITACFISHQFNWDIILIRL